MLSGKNKLEKLKNIISDLNKIDYSILNDSQIKTIDNMYKFYIEGDKNFPDKKKLRKIFRQKRDNLEHSIILEKSEILSEKFLDSKYYKEANNIFCYVSFNNEIITSKILEKTLIDKKNLCVPVIIDNEILPANITNLNNLKKNKFGILEPIDYKILDKNKIDITIVPALVFNHLGFRLGYGGGYYDRFLTDYKNLSIGFCLKDFCIDYFIPDKFDKIVNILFIQ